MGEKEAEVGDGGESGGEGETRCRLVPMRDGGGATFRVDGRGMVCRVGCNEAGGVEVRGEDEVSGEDVVVGCGRVRDERRVRSLRCVLVQRGSGVALSLGHLKWAGDGGRANMPSH
jgi:hypothetical protein